MAEHKMFDREKVQINVARLKKEGKTFEVVIDPDLAMDYKKGNNVELREVLHAEEIFTDPRKGTLAAETDLETIFGTTNPLQVAETIIKEGEIQLSAEYREKLREEKRKKIIEIIRINAIDPKTKLPHPASRIEAAIDEAKSKIDDHKSAEDQIQDIVKSIQTVLPITFSVKKMQLHLTGENVGKLYGTFKHFGTIKKESWNNDGSWTGVIEIPAGLQIDFIDECNKKIQGELDIKILEE